jgi:YjbR protein
MTPDEYRKIALGFRGAVEGIHMDHPDFRVGGKIFATLIKGNGVAMLTPEQQATLVKWRPDVFAPVKGGWGRKGSTTVLLSSADVSSVREALSMAWDNRASRSRSSPAATKGPAKKAK